MSAFYDTGGGIFGGPGFLNRGKGLQFFQPSNQQDTNFILRIKTDNAGVSASNQIMMPIKGTGMVIDWGDGIVETVTQALAPNATLVGGNNVIHTYTVAGEYDVKVGVGLTSVYFDYGGDCLKAVVLKNWGKIVWSTCYSAFTCANLIITAKDSPNFKNVDNFIGAFYGCPKINSSFSKIQTPSGVYFAGMFQYAAAFNQNISHFKVNHAVQMDNMLLGVTLSTANYDKLILSFSAQVPTAPEGQTYLFHGGNSKYTPGGAVAVARQAWIDKRWTITDGGPV